MYYVYILFSQKDKKLYIGVSGNLKKRLSDHKSGHNISTKNRRPLELIYYEVKATSGWQKQKYML